MPTPADVQFSGPLTNVAIEYNNPEYIGDMAVPPTPVSKKEGTFKVYDKDERFTVPPTYVGPRSEPGEIDWNVTEDTYGCEDHGLKTYVSNEEIDNADAPIKPTSDATKLVTDSVVQAKEKRIAAAVFAAANYGANNQVDIEGGWATLSDDALTDIETGIDACFTPPNLMVMGLMTWRKLARNQTLLAAIKGTLKPQALQRGGIAAPEVNQAELAEYLGLEAVIVGRAKTNAYKKGQTASHGFIWDGTNAGKGGAALLRVKPGGALHDVVWGAQFAWKQRQVFTNPTTRGAYGGVEIRVVETNIMKSICTDVGYLFKDCLAT